MICRTCHTVGYLHIQSIRSKISTQKTKTRSWKTLKERADWNYRVKWQLSPCGFVTKIDYLNITTTSSLWKYYFNVDFTLKVWLPWGLKKTQMCSFWQIWWKSSNFLHPHLQSIYFNRPFPDSEGHQIECIPLGGVRQHGDTGTDRACLQRLLQRQETTQHLRVYMNVKLMFPHRHVFTKLYKFSKKKALKFFSTSSASVYWIRSNMISSWNKTDSWEHLVSSEAVFILQERWSGSQKRREKKREKRAEWLWLGLS